MFGWIAFAAALGGLYLWHCAAERASNTVTPPTPAPVTPPAPTPPAPVPTPPVPQPPTPPVPKPSPSPPPPPPGVLPEQPPSPAPPTSSVLLTPGIMAAVAVPSVGGNLVLQAPAAANGTFGVIQSVVSPNPLFIASISGQDQPTLMLGVRPVAGAQAILVVLWTDGAGAPQMSTLPVSS